MRQLFLRVATYIYRSFKQCVGELDVSGGLKDEVKFGIIIVCCYMLVNSLQGEC